MHGRHVPVRARCHVLHGLSAHADRDELLRFFRSGPRPLRAVFVVHGEPASAEALAGLLRAETASPVFVPRLGESADIGGRP